MRRLPFTRGELSHIRLEEEPSPVYVLHMQPEAVDLRSHYEARLSRVLGCEVQVNRIEPIEGYLSIHFRVAICDQAVFFSSLTVNGIYAGFLSCNMSVDELEQREENNRPTCLIADICR